MMTNTITSACKIVWFFMFPLLLLGQSRPAVDSIPGFAYGEQAHPSGKEWESPEALSLNKELPHAYHFSFKKVESARAVLPEYSEYWRSLDGTWKFHWAKTPTERPQDFYRSDFNAAAWDDVPVPMSWNILGIQKDGTLKYGVPIYVNQPVIFQHQVKVDDWRGGVMRTPPQHWTTYIDRNEVGSYRRSFSVPADWKDKEVYINFDGVDSFFYLWINGKYVGFSKNSRNLASFNISKYLRAKGENIVAVEVYRNSDASFLEAQDMFRLPGIFRTVSISAKPKVQIRNLVAIPDLDSAYKQASLQVTAEVTNQAGQDVAGYAIRYSLYANKLYSDEGVKVDAINLRRSIGTVQKGATAVVDQALKVDNPQKWSAENPYRYTLIAELLDRKGKVVDVVSSYIGFRKVEIKDTPAQQDEFGLAGRYFYVNGKPVKLKGVNRHETNPEKGKVISRKQMEEEVKLMKRANINHVRNSHYPDDPYWYYLCDKYGIYLEDEANLESHEYYYGEASLSHPPEWKNAHVARNLEMVHATINHPAIVIWSLGNEAGPGKNFVAAYEAIKKVDVSRPVQYERNNSIVDMGSNQYPSIDWVREAVKGKYRLKYPFHISEYAHSMGNATGNLIDYWEAIESTNFFMGGAIWDWIDQSMYAYDKTTGERYVAYGGDFGDKPNDGTFVMNGLVFSDLTPKPAYFEVRKVYQNVAVRAVDMQMGTVEIFNKNYFNSLDDYDVLWSLWKDGVEIERKATFKGDVTNIAARTGRQVSIPYDFSSLDPQSEYFVKVQFLLKEDRPWAAAGEVQMEEQLLVKTADMWPSIVSVAKGEAIQINGEAGLKVLKGKDFVVKFDDATGSIYQLVYGGNILIRDGEGPRLDALRAPLDNDNWAYQQWFEKGLHQLKHRALQANAYPRADGAYVLSYTVESQAAHGATIRGGSSGTYTLDEHQDVPFNKSDFKFTSNYIWTVYPDGSIELQSSITSNNSSLILPHLGFAMQIPADYGQYSYYGRGPVNNYADRKTGQFIQRYDSTVEGQYFPWPKPQSTGNREDLRWCALTNSAGSGLLFVAKDQFAASALPWSELEMTLAPHTHQLPKSSGTHLYLLADVTGLGGNSCGQGPPLEQDRVRASAQRFGFLIRPLQQHNQALQAKVALAGNMPIRIVRDQKGEVQVASERGDSRLMVQVGNKPAQPYTTPFVLRDAAEVSAWYADNEKSKVSLRFPKIETISMQVLSASSQERGEGNAEHLVDGDPSTIWHTMYSVTVAQYPHWVDFDAGELKLVKGFTYLPRQNGANGRIKGYRLQLSTDGKNWSDTVAEGEFNRDGKLKTIMLAKPTKARFIRFTALSAQDGQDFASAAEFSVLAD
ncbi:glycoside hydrolase family 2 TIM barrel-domain containing protein [Sphingobacterium bambusae]|uniref:beta-galactosidase n=1 Tax=Sphingobacterium bambusae TaxID=662858 RepID=A0ABW6BFD8_9SPHI|nr:glycoside hydrolase family 2 TIM barrel-domain containing protein [Sphingobacterium bambusae]WPL50497.1 glycoside hydrolase family 2 TIM barrel-domain containing protein [Sphingobacterium bambusae]